MGKSAHGKLKLTLDTEKLDKYLELNQIEVEQLTKFFDELLINKKTIPRPNIDYFNLMNEYQNYLVRGIAKNKAELSRQLNVSRAWITIVFRRGSCDYKNGTRLT